MTHSVGPTTLYRVEGAGCLDCAKEVEDHIRHLPGVHQADFNPMSGRLRVIGQADLRALRQIAETEGWQILPPAATPGSTPTPTPSVQDTTNAALPWWRQPRQQLLAVSVALLALGILVEQLHLSEPLALALFVLAILAGIVMPLRSALNSLRRRRLTINTLLVAGTLGAAFLGQWEEAASLVVIFSLGEVMEAYASDRARRTLKALMDLVPPTALRLVGGREEAVPVEHLGRGDLIRVKPGARVPLDGTITEGQSALDESALTGESIPVDKGAGEAVYAGTVNQQGVLTVQVTGTSNETTLAHIIRTVEEARTKKSSYEHFGDRFGAVYTPLMFVLALLVALVPPLLFAQPWEPWFYRALVTLVVSCSCGLVLSVPVATLAAISNGARRGLIIKGGAYLEAASRIDTVALDKTGTLTQGRPEVTDLVPVNGTSPQDLLRLAASVEANSEHPLAAAVVRRAQGEGLGLLPARDFQSLTGRGVRGDVNGPLFVGSPRLAAEQGLAGPDLAGLAELEAQGKTAVAVWRPGTLLGFLGIQDPLRPEAAQAVRQLRAAGVRHVVMLTGDNRRTAEAIARQAGIDEVRAELLPDDKIAVMRGLQAQGRRVVMVGDGINDGPALAQANLGIAMGVRGTDVARETSDVVLMDDDLRRLADVLTLGRQATATIRQNVFVSLAVVALLVPAGLFGLVALVPAITLNEGSALLVIANGLRLLRASLGGTPAPQPMGRAA